MKSHTGRAPVYARTPPELECCAQSDGIPSDAIIADDEQIERIAARDVPREAFAPIPLTQLPLRPRYWLGATVIVISVVSIVLLALNAGQHGV